jgi:type IV pilus assembly protein PilW
MKIIQTTKIKPMKGFTLVEIMVAMTVGILVLIALSAVMINNTTSRRSGDRNATLQTNGRYAIDLLRRDVQHAGYAGSTGYLPNTEDNLSLFENLKNPPLIDNACNNRAGQLEWPLEASDNGNNFACVPADYVLDTDVLLVRHVAQQNVLVPNGALTTDERVERILYYYSDHEAAESVYGVGITTPDKPPLSKPVNLGAVYAVQENVYYIRSWSFSSTESPRIPALVKLSLAMAGEAELVAPGVVDMQLSFGLSSDRAGPAPSFTYQKWNADLVDVKKAINIPNSLESVRISLLMQSLTPEQGYVNSGSYDVGDKTGVTAPGDGYRRAVVSTTVQIRR